MIIRKEIDFNEPLTPEQKKMLADMESRTARPDEDCPELTADKLAELAKTAREKRQLAENKQTVAIRLSPQALATAKSLGKGYTSVLSRILENTLSDAELLRNFL